MTPHNKTPMRWFPIARFFVSATLLIGAYFHLTNIVFGVDLFQHTLFTPLADSLFAIPMTIGAIAIFMARKEYRFRNRLEKAVVIWTGVYFTASLPLHIQTWITQNTDYVRLSPWWFSYVFLTYTTFMQILWWTLKSSRGEEQGPVLKPQK